MPVVNTCGLIINIGGRVRSFMGKRILFSLKNSFAGSHISRCFRRRNPPFKTIIIKKVYIICIYIHTAESSSQPCFPISFVGVVIPPKDYLYL